ncbi:hypothetical protein GCM10027600_00660 [Nocardioides ginsengisegetis]
MLVRLCSSRRESTSSGFGTVALTTTPDHSEAFIGSVRQAKQRKATGAPVVPGPMARQIGDWLAIRVVDGSEREDTPGSAA